MAPRLRHDNRMTLRHLKNQGGGTEPSPAFLLLATNDNDGKPAVRCSHSGPRWRGNTGRAGPARCHRAAGQECQGDRRRPATDFQRELEQIGASPAPHPKRWVSMLEGRAECSVSTSRWRPGASWERSAKDIWVCSSPRGTRKRITVRKLRYCNRSKPHSIGAPPEPAKADARRRSHA